MHAWISWALAALALVAGYASFGWRGLALGATVVVFWLLLLWSRSLRALQQAARAPVGLVGSAVMFNARLHPGMSMAQVLALARSLGRRTSESPETWTWTDATDARVDVTLADGRVTSWALTRPPGPGGS